MTRRSHHRLAALLACMAVALAGLGAIVDVAAAAPPDSATAADGGSPWCYRNDLDARALALCELTGSPAQEHPTTHYGLDTRRDESKKTAEQAKDVASGEAGAVTIANAMCAWLWGALVWAMRHVMNLLEAALTLDLTSGPDKKSEKDDVWPQIKAQLDFLHTKVFGTTWMTAAFAVTGIWALIGMARLRLTQTLAGLAATVVLMIGGLVLVYAPQETIGRASKYLSDGSLAVLTAATGGKQPAGASFAGVEGKLFDRLVGGSTCVLNLGSAAVCAQPVNATLCARTTTFRLDNGWEGAFHDPSPSGRCTIQGALLSTPAGSAAREAIYRILAGEKPPSDHWWDLSFGEFLDQTNAHCILTNILPGCERGNLGNVDPDPSRRDKVDDAREGKEPLDKKKQMRKIWDGYSESLKPHINQAKATAKIQVSNAESVRTRIPLVLASSFGLLGAIIVFVRITIHLIRAKAGVLFLMLAMPLTLFAPAFGEAGRATFLAVMLRLIRHIVEVLVFATAITLLLFISTLFPTLR
jgi:hypothetical protein